MALRRRLVLLRLLRQLRGAQTRRQPRVMLLTVTVTLVDRVEHGHVIESRQRTVLKVMLPVIEIPPQSVVRRAPVHPADQFRVDTEIAIRTQSPEMVSRAD